MAESNAAKQLKPGELDLLEDALELCETPGYEPSDEMSAEVVTRLEDYREILSMTREALTLEDVPAGLLDGVLAEARTAVPEPVAATSSGEGWWARLRRSLVLPGVAVVATAVVVLVLVQPQGTQAPEVASLDKLEERAIKQQQPAPMPGASADDQIETAVADEAERDDAKPALAMEEKAGFKSGDFEAEDLANSMAPPPAPRSLRRDSSAKKSGSEPAPLDSGLVSDKKYDAPASKDQPALEKDQLQTVLDQADAARRAGNCAKAKPLYEQIKQASGVYGSRATAGLGLCAYRGGHHDQADGYFKSARGSSYSIQAWIDTEMAELEHEVLNAKSKRARSNKKSSQKQSKPKSKRMSDPPPQQQQQVDAL